MGRPSVARAARGRRPTTGRDVGGDDRLGRRVRCGSTSVAGEAPQRRLDAVLERPADRRVGQRDPRRLARLGQRVAERLERRRRPRSRPPPTPGDRVAPAPPRCPAAATFSLSSKMIRSASFLPMPGIDTRTAWSWAMIASWRSAVGREPTIASATFGPTPFTVSSSVKNPSSSADRKPYSACWSSRTRW